MRKKVVSMILAATMLTALGGCGTAEQPAETKETTQESVGAESASEPSVETVETKETTETTETTGAENEVAVEIGEPFEETVKITFMNTKPEITEALEEGTKIFGEKYNVEIEFFEASATDALMKKYASGDAPTMSIVNVSTAIDLAGEKIIPLSDEPWCEYGGSEMGVTVDGELYGMPLTIEAKGLIYNKTVIESLLGKEFKPEEYQTLDAFKGLVEELKAAGMETPVVLNAEDWSIGSHFVQQYYILQDGTRAGGTGFLEEVAAGTANFEDNEVYNKVMDALDFFIDNNINKADPLAADYDLNASYVAEGESAFWLNGSWAWPDFAPYTSEDMEYGIMHFPINDAPAVEGRLAPQISKFVVVDKTVATEEQQKAAKMLLNWLVFDEEGQNVLYNNCDIVTPFSNIKLEPNNPFNKSIQEYMTSGMIMDGCDYMPSDHRSALAANLQAYLGGVMSREEVAEQFDEYWKTHSPL